MVSRHLLYENAIFDPNKVLSENSPTEYCFICVITPSQSLKVVFNYEVNPGGHAMVADVMLSRLYPKHKTSVELGKGLGDQGVYFREKEDNIFVGASNYYVTTMIPPKGITQKQYTELVNIMQKVIKTENVANGKTKRISFGDEFVKADQISEKMAEIKKCIIERDIPEQYDIEQYDFCGCLTKEEKWERSKEYGQSLEKQRQEKQKTFKRRIRDAWER